MFKVEDRSSFQGLRSLEIYFKRYLAQSSEKNIKLYRTAELTDSSLINSIRKLGRQSVYLIQLKLYIRSGSASILIEKMPYDKIAFAFT